MKDWVTVRHLPHLNVLLMCWKMTLERATKCQILTDEETVQFVLFCCFYIHEVKLFHHSFWYFSMSVLINRYFCKVSGSYMMRATKV